MGWVDAALGPPQYSLPASLVVPLSRLRHPFVLTNPRLPDGPVVYVSPLFLRLCGYPRCACCNSLDWRAAARLVVALSWPRHMCVFASPRCPVAQWSTL